MLLGIMVERCSRSTAQGARSRFRGIRAGTAVISNAVVLKFPSRSSCIGRAVSSFSLVSPGFLLSFYCFCRMCVCLLPQQRAVDQIPPQKVSQYFLWCWQVCTSVYVQLSSEEQSIVVSRLQDIKLEVLLFIFNLSLSINSDRFIAHLFSEFYENAYVWW